MSHNQVNRSPGLWVTDPGLIIVKTKLSHPLETEHAVAVLQLANAIHLRISSVVNYDHVKTTVPRADIDLTMGKQKFDVAYQTPTGNDILIEVKVRKCK